MHESCQPPRVHSTAIGDSWVIQKDAGREASIKDAWLSAQPLRALAFAWSREVATQLPASQVVALPVPISSEHGLAETSPWRPDLAGG